MTGKIQIIRRLGAAAALVVLGACAQTVTSRPDPLPLAVMANTFASGYRQIAERYIETVALGDMVLRGLNGLGSIDPEISVGRDGERVIVRRGGGEISAFAAPPPDSADGWARLTADIAASAGAASAPLRNAGPEKIYKAVFDAALAGFDKFSRYSTAVQAAENRAKRAGFSGVGVRLRASPSGALIISVFPGSPAAKGGLKKGDLVIRIDGDPVAGLAARELRNKLRGEVDSKVAISVRRRGRAEPLEIEITRARVIRPTVSRRGRDGIITLRVSGFNSHTARQLASNFRLAEKELKVRARGVLVDLRGNPGGLLRQAIRVADLFLVGGRIVSTRGRHPDSVHQYSAQGSDLAHGLPIVVLVDGRSASSAEIVAAALQDQERAVVIGTNSFGKGTVQTVLRLPNDGELTLTWSRFVTPSGYVLHGLGVAPAICTIAGAGADRIIEAAIAGYRKASAKMIAWRNIGRDDKTGRRQLRASCPASVKKRAVDLEVARRLINEPALYRRLISLSPALASVAE